MIPAVRISNLTRLCATVPDGCFVECGVWRGGCLAVLASIAQAEGRGRLIYGFDSFEGLPEQTAADNDHGKEFVGSCAATRQDVIETFETWGIPLDDTRLVKGWFEETVPAICEEMPPIAALRLDGDWYESTRICLEYLYPKLVPGGVVILDDYLTWTGCKAATDEYRTRHDINSELVITDPLGEAWWRKE